MKAISLKPRLAVLAAVSGPFIALAQDSFAASFSDATLKGDVSPVQHALATLSRVEIR